MTNIPTPNTAARNTAPRATELPARDAAEGAAAATEPSGAEEATTE
ncbi:MAG TPA: hypothetical protein VGP24_07955 [Glaciihabitans sp.]|nr:hypothetical protein [Glaciihabitans sp.]